MKKLSAMNSIQKLYSKYFIVFLIGTIFSAGVMTGCSDDNEEQQNLYGYVQFKLCKRASYDEM